MNVGDRVYVLSGFDVEEREVYEIREDGPYAGPWIVAPGRLKTWAGHYRGNVHTSLDEAVAASKAARERAIKRCAAEMVRLGINTNVKVKLMKKPAKAA